MFNKKPSKKTRKLLVVGILILSQVFAFSVAYGNQALLGWARYSPYYMEEVTLSYSDNADDGEEGRIISGSSNVTVRAIKGMTLREAGIALRKGPEREKHRFAGWYVGTKGEGERFTEDYRIFDNMDVAARWVKTYTVSFNALGGDFGQEGYWNMAIQMDHNYMISQSDVPTAKRAGYKYDYWNTKPTGKGIKIPKNEVYMYNFENRDTTLYPMWEVINPDQAVTVTFDKNIMGEEDNATVDRIRLVRGDHVGDAMPEPPQRRYYKFTGWSYKRNGAGDSTFTGTTGVNSSVTVYAQWKVDGDTYPDVDKVRVNFTSPKANVDAQPATLELSSGDKIGYFMPESPQRVGYLFKGWMRSDTKEDVTAETVVERSLTLEPKWELFVTGNLNYGNSPYALIMKDNGLTSDEKERYKKSFDENRNTFVTGKVPRNGTEGEKFSIYAWGKKSEEFVNYDKLENAVFMYAGKSFTDPGISHLVGPEYTEYAVKRTVEVDVFNENRTGQSRQKDFSNVTRQRIQLKDGEIETEMDNLVNVKVRPGVYQIVYTYVHPQDGNSVIATRPLIALYDKGDVDLSGTVDMKDADLINKRYKEKLPYDLPADSSEATPAVMAEGAEEVAQSPEEKLAALEIAKRVYKYRICDINQDGNVNAVDGRIISAKSGK